MASTLPCSLLQPENQSMLCPFRLSKAVMPPGTVLLTLFFVSRYTLCSSDRPFSTVVLALISNQRKTPPNCPTNDANCSRMNLLAFSATINLVNSSPQLSYSSLKMLVLQQLTKLPMRCYYIISTTKAYIHRKTQSIMYIPHGLLRTNRTHEEQGLVFFINNQVVHSNFLYLVGPLGAQASSPSSQSQLRSLANLAPVDPKESSPSSSEKDETSVSYSQTPSALRNTAFEMAFTKRVNPAIDSLLFKLLDRSSCRLMCFSFLERNSSLASSSMPSVEAPTIWAVLVSSDRKALFPKPFSSSSKPKKLEKEEMSGLFIFLLALKALYRLDQMRQTTQATSLKILWLNKTISSTSRLHTSASFSRSSMKLFLSCTLNSLFVLIRSARGAVAGCEGVQERQSESLLKPCSLALAAAWMYSTEDAQTCWAWEASESFSKLLSSSWWMLCSLLSGEHSREEGEKLYWSREAFFWRQQADWSVSSRLAWVARVKLQLQDQNMMFYYYELFGG